MDRNSGRPDARGREGKASPYGGEALGAGDRSGRGGSGRINRGTSCPRRAAGSAPADRLIHLPGADGRLTDGQGHTVDFRNTLIVMTSNLGSEYLVNQPEGQETDAVRDHVMAAVRARFRPEFLNRVDDIILFHRLKRDQMAGIVDIQMKRIEKLLEDRKISIKLDAKGRDWLANKGYDPAYGARPLKRVIQKYLQDPLAELILSGRVKDGDNVAVSATKFGLTFNGKVAAAA